MTCVRWEDVESVNVVDFDVVVGNMRSLTDKILKTNNWRTLRTQLSRLLVSDGRIIIIGDKSRRAETSKTTAVSNYSWLPIGIGAHAEAGTTIEVENPAFPTYMNRFKRWDYYYFVSENSLTSELVEIFGPPNLITYTFNLDPYAVNRYARMLAGRVTLKLSNHTTGESRELGDLIALPHIEELEAREAVNLVLEDLLSLPQVALPPEWVASVVMPIVPEIEAAIAKKRAAISKIEIQISEGESQKRELEQFKRLLYATGSDLENIFAACLERCGGKITPATYSQEEFVLEYKSEIYLVECKGVGKSIALSHIRQLFDYMTKYEEDTEQKGKGILLGNPWRDRPLEDRAKTDTVIFPDNVVSRANQLSISLVWSVGFFQAFCRLLAQNVSGEAILDRITGTVGIVPFDSL